MWVYIRKHKKAYDMSKAVTIRPLEDPQRTPVVIMDFGDRTVMTDVINSEATILALMRALAMNYRAVYLNADGSVTPVENQV